MFASSAAYSHGGAAIEFDTCVVELGKYTMHFTAYQIATGGTEHCWQLPAAGKTTLVFDLVQTEMRSKPVELRVVETTEGSDQVATPIRTVAQLPTNVYPTGTLNVEADIDAAKRYMAVLTMGDTRPLVMKAPIWVEPAGIGFNPILIILVAVAVGGVAFYFLKMRRGPAVQV
ncbi:MAG: hypothetical protein ACREWG_10845 [Gammaproteobacteria bacterium]